MFENIPPQRRKVVVSEGIALRSPSIKFAPLSLPLPYTVFAPTLFEFNPTKSSLPPD